MGGHLQLFEEEEKREGLIFVVFLSVFYKIIEGKQILKLSSFYYTLCAEDVLYVVTGERF